MKNESTYAKKFATLYKKIKADAEPMEPMDDVVSQMIFGFLMWEASRKQAENAYKRLVDATVDHNELRVSRPSELVDIIGSSYPKLDERIERMRDSLQTVYVREHVVTTVVLEGKTKKDIKEYFDSLPGMPQYVSAHVRLVTFGAHTIPADEKLANLLRHEGAVHPRSTVEEIGHFLERQFKAGEGVAAHVKLQAWVDAGSKRASSGKPAKTTKAAKTTKKKVAKKKVAKTTKKVAKKTTKKVTMKTIKKKTKKAATPASKVRKRK